MPHSFHLKRFSKMKQIPNDLFFAWVESEIEQGRSVQIRLKGVSMYPLLREGKDEVVLSACPVKDLLAMDLVLFKYQSTHILHRVISRDGDMLVLRGDGSFRVTESCSVHDVIGRVEAVVRPSGKAISVKSWKWRLPSFLWCKMGIFRRPVLRMLFFLKKHYICRTGSDNRMCFN